MVQNVVFSKNVLLTLFFLHNIDNLIYLLLATNHSEFSCVCGGLHVCMCAHVYRSRYVYLHMHVGVGRCQSSGLIHSFYCGWVFHWSGPCLLDQTGWSLRPSAGITVCLAFLCGCCGIEIRASCERPVIVSIHKLHVLDFNFLLWFSFLFHRHTLTC